jgi:L-alanine-DL-glutamate epimerase-like enolase superfamily enzyme
MKISEVSVQRYRGSARADYAAEIQVVEVRTDEGITGRGFASTSATSADLLASMIRHLLGPCVVGADPLLTTDLWRRMHSGPLPRRGGDGLARVAISAIDFALWDIKGKRAGAPVSSLLGGRRERIPTYANCAHHLPPDELAARAAEYVARGHRALKIRGSRTFVTLTEATERVLCVREAVGPDVRLMVDVNGTWDVDTAIQQLKAWEPHDVYWLEEPVPPQDIAGYVRVRERAGHTYVAGGEQHVGLVEFRELIERGAVDVAQPNAAVTGGITDWLRIHAFATAHGVPVSPWNLQAVHLHMAAGLPNVQWIEYFMPDNALLEFQTRLLAEPAMREEVTPEGVFLLAPTAPGLGLELDPEVAERSLVRE